MHVPTSLVDTNPASPGRVAQLADSASARGLFEHHQRHLRDSGWREETWRVLGVYSTDDPAEIAWLLRWTDERAIEQAKSLGACIVFPYQGIVGFAKLKPDSPRRVGRPPDKRLYGDACGHNYGHEDPVDDRKIIKYESPVGAGTHVYAPEVICPGLRDWTQMLFVVEGEKKAGLLCQEGRPAISIPGVSAGHDVEARAEAQDWGGPEFNTHHESLPFILPGRDVCVLFDSPDMEEKISVIRAAVRQAGMIQGRNANALIGYVDHFGGEKTGVDDMYMHCKARVGLDYDVFACDFAKARPAAPNELLEWLHDQRAENGWTPKELRAEVRRAVIWARVWHEHDNKRFWAWAAKVTKRFEFSREAIEEMVAHLGIGRASALGGDGESWKGFNTAMMVEHCLPALNTGFRLHRDIQGVDKVFAVNAQNEAVLLISEAPLEQALHDHLKNQFKSIPPAPILGASISLWKKECPKLTEEPVAFTFKNDDRLCFKHFDWEPVEGRFEAWNEFLSRLSDRDAFMAYVWSCFEEKNQSRQYVWLRGDGQDGKSRVQRAIQSVFGVAAAGITNTIVKGQNQFTYSAIYGKRAAFYSDCKNTKFGMTEFVRNCTSGDPVPIEFKGQTPFLWNMYVKLFVASNSKPQFSSEVADLSRVIYVEVAETLNKDDPTWPARLEQEMPAFLWACRDTYRRLCPHHGDIRVGEMTKQLRGEASTAFEERFHDIFELSFVVKEGAKLQASEVAKVLRGAGLTNQEVADFKAWLERTHKVKYRPTRAGRFYENLALSAPAEVLSEFRLARP